MTEVSFGMPALNAEKTIARAIEDIQAQTFTDFELVICDNASDDHTAEIAEAYAQKDPRIKLIRFAERVDIRGSFQRALDNTKAPYFAFAPTDDRWYPEFTEETHAVLAADPDLMACTGQVAFFVDGLFSHVSKGTAPLVGSVRENTARYLYDPVENARAFSLIRREAMAGVFPSRTYPGWDFQMTARSLQFGKYQEIPKILAERDVTTLAAYIDQADRFGGWPLLRVFPLRWVAWHVLLDRKIPKSAGLISALGHLVWLSHLNYSKIRLPSWSRTLACLTINR